jgi:hypothetical protein
MANQLSLWLYEPSTKDEINKIRVIRLDCPFKDTSVACTRSFINTQDDNEQVRKELLAHLNSKVAVGGHEFGNFRCFHVNCSDRAHSTSTLLWNHVDNMHKQMDEQAMRDDPLGQHRFYACPICTDYVQTWDPFYSVSQTEMNYHFKQVHHPGLFSCTRPDCEYVGTEQSSVVQHFDRSQ